MEHGLILWMESKLHITIRYIVRPTTHCIFILLSLSKSIEQAGTDFSLPSYLFLADVREVPQPAQSHCSLVFSSFLALSEYLLVVTRL